MDFGQVGNNATVACPFCDELFVVKAGDDDFGRLMGRFADHMATSAACRDAKAKQPAMQEAFGAMRAVFKLADVASKEIADANLDNGQSGWWRVTGVRHEATARASSAREAIDKCAEAGAVGTWEGAEANFIGAELPDVF